jgi:hypothetical protein
VAQELAARLGIPHARYELAVAGGERGVITPRITSDLERLVHGNELLVEVIPDYASKSAAYRTPSHTVDAVVAALSQPDREIALPRGDLPQEVTTAVDVLAGYLMLDALIGNTDRHHENWAVIESPASDGGSRFRMAPTFDHASCLGRNEPVARIEERLKTRDRNYGVEAYAVRADSALYRSAGDLKPMSPLDAFEEISVTATNAAKAWCARLSRLDDAALHHILRQVPMDRMQEPYKEFTTRMLRFNRSRLRDVCKKA